MLFRSREASVSNTGRVSGSASVSAEGPVLTAHPDGSGPARSQTPAPSCRPAPQTPPSYRSTRKTSLTNTTRTIVDMMNSLIQSSAHCLTFQPKVFELAGSHLKFSTHI